jgi:RNA polymerase sigma factor (TIGR02999 family)
MNEITSILSRVAAREPGAMDELLESVYQDLKSISRNFLARERDDHTLQPTALVHEAYLKLLGQEQLDWQNRAHFFAVSSRLIRRILVDHARGKLRKKRGDGAAAEPLEETRVQVASRNLDLLALDEALEVLEKEDRMAAQVVEMRFFGGQHNHEIAHVLEVNERTVRRHWNFAKTWLFQRLGD